MLYEEAVRNGAQTEATRAPRFASFLRAKLDEIFAEPLRDLPLVISGMASSSVGWRELAYGIVPSTLDGRGLKAQELDWQKPAWLGPTYLISGLATQHEMMRGEETEIIGLMTGPSLAAFRKNCLLILPGTHSKHVRIENEAIVDWRTFMTGELFDVLGRHSLLRASVTCEEQPDTPSEEDRSAFREGVLWAQEHGLAGGLFRVRTRCVLGRRPLAENTWFFSGLLIGTELLEIGKSAAKPPVILAAAGRLAGLYPMALELIAAGQKLQWIQVPAEQIEAASVAAHALFLDTKDQRSTPADTRELGRGR